MRTLLGHALLWIGFVAAAFLSVHQMENPLGVSFKNVKEGDKTQVEIAAVEPASDAMANRVKPGDVVVLVSGTEVKSRSEAEDVIRKSRDETAGVRVQLKSNDETRNVTLPYVDKGWSVVGWPGYALSMGIGIVGIVLLRTSRQEARQDTVQTEAEYSAVQSSLREVVGLVDELAAIDEYNPSSVVNVIDHQLAEPLAQFAEARESMAKRFGMSLYADVMTEFASGERYVNRTWSAAADGYVDEVATSIQRASGHFRAAQDLLKTAEESSA